MWDTIEITATGLSHDMPCIHCGHAPHVYVACDQECSCGPRPRRASPPERSNSRPPSPPQRILTPHSDSPLHGWVQEQAAAADSWELRAHATSVGCRIDHSAGHQGKRHCRVDQREPQREGTVWIRAEGHPYERPLSWTISREGKGRSQGSRLAIVNVIPTCPRIAGPRPTNSSECSRAAHTCRAADTSAYTPSRASIGGCCPASSRR